MDNARAARASRSWGALEPLRQPAFRTIWLGSVVGNFGQLILGVGAAWEMTRLATADMVALVQTALMVPIMLVSVPAGAIADMFDRRKIALVGLSFASACAATLTALAILGLTTPWVLLAFCTLIGAGVALYSPAWGASISEQVEAKQLPAAIALGSISYNVARSFGPAVGGVIVATAGARAAFGTNAVAYLPLLAAFFMWRRKHIAPRLPPERIDRAIISGTRYVLHAPPVRSVLVRAFSFGAASAAAAALVPLAARYLLAGNASTYGLLLGCAGVGAVGGALLVSAVREHVKAEHAYAGCAIAGGLMIVGIGLSRSVLLTGAFMAVGGAVNMLAIALLNVAVQLSVPRWVAARALAWFQASLTGGVAIGAFIWGVVAADWGVGRAFLASGIALMLTPLIGLLSPIPRVSAADVELIDIGHEPEVVLAITARSGPIVIEIDYRVAIADARSFYNVMLRLQRVRQRNGAFDWSIARNIVDPELWTERYHCPTWADYLRQRSRLTQGDRALQASADTFDKGGHSARVRRRLERPFGSVRWQADTPDVMGDSITAYTS